MRTRSVLNSNARNQSRSRSPARHSTRIFKHINDLGIGETNGKGPFGANISGGAWNAQGLFHSSPTKARKKKEYLGRHLQSKDFWLISGAHGDVGKSEAFETWLNAYGFVGYWSHCGRHRAGVGILVKMSFLQSFRLADPEWLHLVQGEVAC